MQYMLLIHGDEAKMPSIPPEKAYEMSTAYAAYTEALKKAGALVAGERLKPTKTASIVRLRADKTEVLDGPFAEIKEQFGGYYIIEAADQDEAVEWAAKCPGASLGAVEVRAIWPAT